MTANHFDRFDLLGLQPVFRSPPPSGTARRAPGFTISVSRACPDFGRQSCFPVLSDSLGSVPKPRAKMMPFTLIGLIRLDPFGLSSPRQSAFEAAPRHSGLTTLWPPLSARTLSKTVGLGLIHLD
jgi:hypothetical protein